MPLKKTSGKVRSRLIYNTVFVNAYLCSGAHEFSYYACDADHRDSSENWGAMVTVCTDVLRPPFTVL